MVPLASVVGWWFLGVLLLITPQPGTSWYKHSASPKYHTVGRASGLLIGVRRSPYLWRRELIGRNVQENLQGTEGEIEDAQGQLDLDSTSHMLPIDSRDDRLAMEKRKWKKQMEFERSLEEVRRDLQEKDREEWEKINLQGPGEKVRRLQVSTEEQGRLGTKVEETNIRPGEDGASPDLENLQQEGAGILPRYQEREISFQGETKRQEFPWTRQIRTDPQTRDTQNFHPGSWTLEEFSCDDFKLNSYKVLCQAKLLFLPHSPLEDRRQRRTTEEPETPL